MPDRYAIRTSTSSIDDANQVRQKMTDHQKGRNGLCVAKTKQAILVGHHGETHQAGNATQTVEALADYLIGVGY